MAFLVGAVPLKNTVRVWESPSDEDVSMIQPQSTSFTESLFGINRVSRVIISPDHSLVASSSDDGIVRLWRTDTGNCTRGLDGHKGVVYAIAFSPDSAMIATGSKDRTVRLWQTERGKCVHVLHTPEDETWTIAFSVNGEFIAAGTAKGTVWVWRTDTGKIVHSLRGDGRQVCAVKFSIESTFVISGYRNGDVGIWRVDTGECIHFLGNESGLDHWGIKATEAEDERHIKREIVTTPDLEFIAWSKTKAWDDELVLWRRQGEKYKLIARYGHDDVGIDSAKITNMVFSSKALFVAWRPRSYGRQAVFWRVSIGDCVQVDTGNDCRFTYESEIRCRDADSLAESMTDIGYFGVYADNIGELAWITRNEQNFVWLPNKLHPLEYLETEDCDASGPIVAIGARSNNVIIIDFSRHAGDVAHHEGVARFQAVQRGSIREMASQSGKLGFLASLYDTMRCWRRRQKDD
ncbi:Vegetative incompatibility HET-E-1-like protein [Cladobotryum mycophilum]|uniref:Vegetative incompatibility HET-E-1-like protein n=1 Tax=Cladobotryum mycophilum TaxID=491253 RepID=A0ABR0T0F8_9HYPO